jgi:CubicO group peptidase (beta-lactamase class C family)
MVEGKVVWEDYPNGGHPERPHELASGTKSFSGLMAVAAAQDGLLALDEPVAQTLSEWRDDPLRSAITIRQLLQLVSGLPGGRLGRPPTYAEAVQTPAAAHPGSRFSYGPIPFQVFGELMRRKLGGDPLAYLERRIFFPLGLEYAFWRRGPDGYPHLPSGAFLTARNWARLGELVRTGGVWQGRRLLDEALVAECFLPSSVNPFYGLTWWLSKALPPQQQTALRQFGLELDQPGWVVAAGAGGQRLYVHREKGWVVVRQAAGILESLEGNRPPFSDRVLLRLLTGPGEAP